MLSIQGKQTGQCQRQPTHRTDHSPIRNVNGTDCGLTPRGQLNITGSLVREKRKKQNSGPKASVFDERRNSAPTKFRVFYDRGDIPVTVDTCVSGVKLRWKVQIENLDFYHFLPVFFDGLRESRDPYAAIANQGTQDLLHHGNPDVIAQVIPQLIIPIKCAFETRNQAVMCRTLKSLQHLVMSSDKVGLALVPYYRQILPIMNLFKNRNCNTGDAIDYSQHKRENLGDLIEDTLQLLERHGGDDAYINIKYMVPTYESCLLN